MGEVADLGDGLKDVAELQGALVPAYAQPVGGVIHLYIFHARQPRKVVLAEPHAGGTGDAFQNQCRLAHMLALAAHEALLHVGMVVHRGLAQKRGYELAPGRGGLRTVAVILAETAIDDGLGHCFAATAAHRPARAVDDRTEVGSRRQRQAAVEAARRCFSGGRCGRFGGRGGHARHSSARCSAPLVAKAFYWGMLA